MDNIKLPEESESQELGHYAVLTFHSCQPTSWRTTPTDGDADAGLDMQVQIVDQGHYTNAFNAQIKGSAQEENDRPKHLNSAGTYFSHSLKITTLNYYIRIENPVMLVFADLTQNPNPRKCPAYYLWIDEELDKLRNGKTNLDHLNKDSHTFHIPLENKLVPELDVLPYLNNRLKKKRALEGIYSSIEKKYQDPIDKINQINNIFEKNKIALDTVLNETDSPWLNAPKDSFAHQLKLISEALTLNNAKLAKELIDKIDVHLKDATDHEKSEYYYLKGFSLELIGKREDAVDFHKKAHLTTKEIKKYHIAYLEARFPYEREDKNEINLILDEILQIDDPAYNLLKSKCLAFIGRHEEALKILSTQDEKNVIVSKAVILLLQGSYQECINYIDKSFSEQKITQRQKLSLKSLKARSYFYLGFEKIPINTVIPFAGTQEMKPEILKNAWIELIEAWELAKTLGYPPDVESMMDMFSILGMYFSEGEIVKRHLVELADIRPANSYIQESLLKVAMHLDDLLIAEKQLSKLPKTISTDIDRIIVASRRKNKLEVVKLTNDVFEELKKEKSQYGTILAIAAECANDSFDYANRDKFIKALENFIDGKALIAVYEFLNQLKQNPLKKGEATEKLYSTYKQGHKNNQLLTQLFNILDPYEIKAAERIIDISKDILLERELLDSEYIILCNAKATTKDWDSLLKSSRMAQKRFSINPRLKAFEALALYEIGNVGESVSLLENIVEGKKYDPLVFEIYINISARCGLIDKTKNLVKDLLGRTENRENRLYLLRMLFNIEVLISPKSIELLNICLNYGKLCNQGDEIEEGIYLLLFFRATINPEQKVEEKDTIEFQTRLRKYTEKFPESKILKTITFNEDSPEELLTELNKISGFTEEREIWYKRNENLLKSGKFPIPYVIRHKILLNISNLIYLWELAKITDKEYPQYQLTISTELYKIHEIKNFNNRIPLIDEVALLVLYELELLKYLFIIFSTVAIPKSTINTLQMIAQQAFSTGDSIKAKNIIQYLSKYLNNILLPSKDKDKVLDEKHILFELDYVKSTYCPSKYFFYSDDALARQYICGDNHNENAICTLDLITFARNNKIISFKEAAEKYAILCSFNIIGTLANFKDILLVIEDEVKNVESVKDILKKIENHKLFNFFINAIWFFKYNYKGTLNSVSDFIVYMITGEDGIKAHPNLIIAVWYIWYQKVKFMPNSEKGKLFFLIHSFLFILIKLNGRKPPILNKIFWTKAWSMYMEIVNLVYGNEMDRNIEDDSIIILAQSIANHDHKHRPSLFNSVTFCLEDNTAASDLLKKSYEEARINLSAKNKI